MPPERSAPAPLRNLIRRSWRDWALLAEATVRMTALRLYLDYLGPVRQRKLYGKALTPAAGEAINAAMGLSLDQRRLARRIGWAIERAERVLPYDVVCLPQAIVGRRMLRRRGIASVMFFGVETAKPLAEAGTHAWLIAGDVPVTGCRQAVRYKVFASYPTRMEAER